MTGSESAPASEPTPPSRIESEDELLDAAEYSTGPAPGLRLAGLRLSRIGRFRRTLRVLAVGVVAAAVAVWSGISVHSADQRDKTQAAHAKVLLRLVGGEGLMQPAPPGLPDQALATTMSLVFRNDGASPVTIVDASIRQPGVKLESTAVAAKADPGETVGIAVRIVIDCADQQLPEHPDSVALKVRGADGKDTPLAFPFTQPQPPAAGESTASGTFFDTMPGTDDYYALCGQVSATVQPEVSYLGLSSKATRAKPVFGLRMKIVPGGPARILTQPASGYTPPGMTVTTDLGPTQTIPEGGSATVTLTVQASDCASIKQTILSAPDRSSLNGLEFLQNQPVLDMKLADRRFQGDSRPMSVEEMALDGSGSAFVVDFLSQLLAACPDLQ
jgi:hypothetical protein